MPTSNEILQREKYNTALITFNQVLHCRALFFNNCTDQVYAKAKPGGKIHSISNRLFPNWKNSLPVAKLQMIGHALLNTLTPNSNYEFIFME